MRTSQDSMAILARPGALGTAALVVMIGFGAPAQASEWNLGDVFAGVADGLYQVYDGDGNLKEVVDTGVSGFTTGCTFNTTLDKLYTTVIHAGIVVVFDDAHAHPILRIISTGGEPESVVFAGNGHFYVGGPSYSRIQEYDPDGNLVDSDDVASDGTGGPDWIDLATDQRTIFYACEGRQIYRYDVVDDVQLPLLAQLPSVGPVGGAAFALRLLPPGDGSGGLLIADSFEVKRLDGAGEVVQTYDVAGEDKWFSLNLDPNGTSFWAGDFQSGNFYKFDIDTGQVEVGPINTGTGPVTLFGICLKGEATAAIEGPPGSVSCSDDLDNDGDGLVDRLDPDCWACGDGVIDPGEECDDGNRIDGDGCSADCALEFADTDGDGIHDGDDNCPELPNPDQDDADADGLGDVCDACPADPKNDVDGDGLCGDVDACGDTLIPESVPIVALGVNRFALVDDDGQFDTRPPTGRGPGRSYSVMDTGGCSCQQIIEELGLGRGHSKFGCSISAMDEWIATLP